jgi:CubicO group peptidase (beta-lactamase class C family)
LAVARRIASPWFSSSPKPARVRTTCVPGRLGIFHAGGAFGQRILVVPKLDLVLVRLGDTAPHEVGAVVRHVKELADAFRPTAA